MGFTVIFRTNSVQSQRDRERGVKRKRRKEKKKVGEERDWGLATFPPSAWGFVVIVCVCWCTVELSPWRLQTTTPYLENQLWRVGRHLLDVHPALRAAHHHRAIACAVHEDGEVRLPGDVQSLGHHHLAHRTGMTQRGKEQAKGDAWDFLWLFTEAYTVPGNAKEMRESSGAK